MNDPSENRISGQQRNNQRGPLLNDLIHEMDRHLSVEEIAAIPHEGRSSMEDMPHLFASSKVEPTADAFDDPDYIMDDEEQESREESSSQGSKKKAGVIKENTNIYKSAFHIFKANVGTGVFLLPTFYKDAGYVMGPILAVLIGSCVIDATHMLLRTKLVIDRPDVTTYSQICQYIFGPVMRWILFVALILTQFGFCLMYIQLASGTMDDMVSFKGSAYVWMFIVFCIVFPITCFADNMSILAVASIAATIAVAFALVATLVRSAIQIHSNGGIHSQTNAVGKNIPIGWFNNLANNMMVLEGIAIVLPVHSACIQKNKFSGMLTFVLVGVIMWYLLYGMIGYSAYGDSLSISLIDAMPDDKLSIVIRVAFIVNLVCTHPVQFQSAIQLIDQVLGFRSRSWKGILVRLLINMAITGLAMGIGADTVNTVVSFIGALPATVMVLILPSMLILQLDYAVANPEESRMSRHYWLKVITQRPWCSFLRFRCYLYIVVGLLIMVIGTYSIAITL